MKLDTGVVLTKGLCYVVIGGLTPLTVSLAQWANSDQWPSRLIWIITIASCGVGAATQLLSFLSGSYTDYVKGRANGTASPGDSTAILAAKAAAKSQLYQDLEKVPQAATVAETPKP
jgi:hypothetical protein